MYKCRICSSSNIIIDDMSATSSRTKYPMYICVNCRRMYYGKPITENNYDDEEW